MRKLCLLALALISPLAQAQPVDTTREVLNFERGEAWAMAYVTASTLLTGFGATPELAPGDLAVSAELGHIPRLDDEQQQVGLGGAKSEDLNKSPVFGRGRVWVGLPFGFVGEIGYTPPLELDGVEPNDLFAFGLGRRLYADEIWSLSARLHGQVGSAHGDITCPEDIAASTDPLINPFRCTQPSDDRIKLRYHALEATAAFGAEAADWHSHLTAGVARMEPRVQVNARTQTIINRPYLATTGSAPYFAAGATRALMPGWSVTGEVMYVPLDVRRDPEDDVETDSFWSLRLALRYRFGAE